VRIKTLQALYAWQQADLKSPEKGAATLKNSLQQTHDVYLFLLEFPWHFSEYLESEKEAEKAKYYPNKEFIRTFGILAHTPFAHDLWSRVSLRKRRHFDVSWNALAESFNEIFKLLHAETFVVDYMVFEEPSIEQQREFLEELYNWIILACEPFHDAMESAYAGWNDDEELLLKEVLKTINSAKADVIHLSSQDDTEGEEIQFALKLFETVAVNTEVYEKQISDITDNWDPSRIAILDLISIKMALAEFLCFPQIPLKVTINEYLDVIKDYSTPSSSRFLNGILDKMRKKLELSGDIRKAGRGLRDK